jgi:hypothetical protein
MRQRQARSDREHQLLPDRYGYPPAGVIRSMWRNGHGIAVSVTEWMVITLQNRLTKTGCPSMQPTTYFTAKKTVCQAACWSPVNMGPARHSSSNATIRHEGESAGGVCSQRS